ncbi:MAG: NUDIX hydrolase [Pirellula sp.]
MPKGRLLFRAKRFDVESVTESLPDGQSLERHIVRHPGAVVILPLVDASHICLIHTYRSAIDRWHLELPAGTLDQGLPPDRMAHLELQQETGYLAGRMEPLHTFVMSPGILDERMHLYVASDLTQGDTARELGEQIDNRIVSWSEVDRLLRDHQILDAKTLVGLLWYMRYRQHA